MARDEWHEPLECGHTPHEHAEMDELSQLISHITQFSGSSRVVFTLRDDGNVEFATSIPPGEAAQALEQMARKIRSYPANYVSGHFDRASRADCN